MIRRSFAPLLVVAFALGCGKGETLTVAPTEPAPPELVPSAQLQELQYKRILLLPPADTVDLKEVGVAVVEEKRADYYVGKLEKAMLSAGFEVISPEIVARAEKALGAKASALSAAEKAMVMGRDTQAEAVFILQSVAVYGEEAYFTIDGMKATRVDAGRVKQRDKKRKIRKKGRYSHVDTEDCLVRLPFYEVRLEGKLLDAHTGDVLWVGAGRETVLDAMTGSWVAKIDKRCNTTQQNFVFVDQLADETTLATTVAALLGRMLGPLKIAAFAGKPIVVAAKPEPKPDPKPEPAKAKVAIVSGDKAALRSGPNKKDRRIRYVPRKAEVEVLETMGEWTKVKVQDGTTGWMHESAIILPK